MELGYTDVLGIGYNPPRRYVPLGIELGLVMVETEEACKEMIDAALDYGFLKIYVKVMSNPVIGNVRDSSQQESRLEVGENNIGDSTDKDYIPNNDEERSVSSGDPNSSDDELVIARKNLKEFNDLVVDNGIGLGLDKCTRGFKGSSGAGTSRSNDIESDNSGYHSEYLASEGA